MNKKSAETVYPSIFGGFPAATFFSFSDALAYIREMQMAGAKCGMCTCPAASYEMHLKDTIR